ncbi:MAG: YdcF family protein [Candidatus Nanoarchaeia archaeon]
MKMTSRHLKLHDTLYSQIIAAKELDALVVLGGEGKEHSRSNHVFSIYSAVKDSQSRSLYIILTGGHHGVGKASRSSESGGMKQHLSALGVPDEVMRTENASRDSLTNIIFSQFILDDLDVKRFGLVTDQFHMLRALWTAYRVLDGKYEIIPCPTRERAGLRKHLVEAAIKQALRFELRGIHSGDQETFFKYVWERHPLYVHDAPFGAYRLGVEVMKLRR